MSIKVEIKPRDPEKATQTVHGENVTVDGAVLRVWTEPHEIKPGGLVDLFIGEIFPLDVIESARVRRV